MPAYDFPAAPVNGQRYPVNPGTSGAAQYEWDSTVGVWNVVSNFVRTNNQSAYNSYSWPNSQGGAEEQLTDLLGNGVLSWQNPGGPFTYLDDISAQFDGITTAFTLTISGVPYTPSPSTNVVIFLGGVIQVPGAANAYSVAGAIITFFSAPAAGTSFTGITSL